MSNINYTEDHVNEYRNLKKKKKKKSTYLVFHQQFYRAIPIITQIMNIRITAQIHVHNVQGRLSFLVVVNVLVSIL